MTADHVIEMQADNDRTYWTCECGMAGSASSDRVDVAAEKHIRNDESIAYRTRKVDW